MALKSKEISVLAGKGHHTLKMKVWEDKTNVADNVSECHWELWIESKSYKWDYDNGKPVWWAATFDGTKYSGTVKKYYPPSLKIGSGTKKVKHNADGTRNLTFSCAIDSENKSYLTGYGKVSGSMDLTYIPREAKLTSVANFNDEQNPIIKYNNPAGNAIGEDCLEAFISSNQKSDDIAKVRRISRTATSYTFNLTDTERNNIRNVCKDVKSKSIYFYVRTKLAGKWVNSYKSAIVNIINGDIQINPTAKDINQATIDLTGNTNTVVKGFSKIQADTGAAARKNAWISEQKISNGSQTIYSGNGTFNNADGNQVYFFAKDSRGNYKEHRINFNFVDYIPLTCDLVVKPELQGEQTTSLKLNISGNYFQNTFGKVENTFELKYRYKLTKEKEEAAWNEWVILTPAIKNNKYAIQTEIPNLNYKEAYDVQVLATDKLTQVISNKIDIKTLPLFDWGKDDFNFNIPIKIKGQMMIDFVVEEGQQDIWYYRKWNSGKAECWGGKWCKVKSFAQWGNIYSGKLEGSATNFPFTFKYQPYLFTSINSKGYNGWLATDTDNRTTATTTAAYNFLRPTAANPAEFQVQYFAIGFWK